MIQSMDGWMDVTADWRRAKLSAHIQPNVTKLTGWRVTLQIDNDPNTWCECNSRCFEAEEIEYCSMTNSVT